MTEWLKSRKTEFIALAVAAVMVVADQLTKFAISSDFTVGESRPVINGVLHFTYVRNDGAVFGSFSGKPYIFNTVTVIVVIAGIFLLLAGKLKNNWLKWAAALAISGGIGNMIDRIRLKYVVDFIDVRCFGKLWVWVFNVADCCVVIGCIIMLIYFTVDIITDFKNERNLKRHSDGDTENADERTGL